MIDAAAIREIAELGVAAEAVEVIEIGDRKYTDKAIHEVIQKEPEPAALTVHTLSGLIDYIAVNKDGLDLSEYSLHVVNPARVDLISRTRGQYHQRFSYVTAQNYDRFAALPLFAFGQFVDLEVFNVALQALFENREDRAVVLRLLGSVKDDASVTREDDGATQKVSARAGVVLRDSVEVPNPVTLAPFRTFPDVPQQPASPFILRVKKADGIVAALFEADGGAWRNIAIDSIASWLGGQLADLDLQLSIIA